MFVVYSGTLSVRFEDTRIGRDVEGRPTKFHEEHVKTFSLSQDSATVGVGGNYESHFCSFVDYASFVVVFPRRDRYWTAILKHK